MSCCTRPRERGQALIEMAFVLPVGLLLLLAVGYLGRALLERQTLVAAARYAAREASLGAMHSPADKASGKGVLHQTLTAGDRTTHIRSAAKGRPAESAPPRWEPVTGAVLTRLQPRPLGPYGMAFVAQHSQTMGTGKPLKFGIGFVLYGARAKERLAFLETVRKATDAASKANPKPARGLSAPLEISASAYMPGELPLHGEVGLLEINPWIKDILEE